MAGERMTAAMFAHRAARLARLSSDWCADALMPPRKYPPEHSVERFIALAREILDDLERDEAAGRRALEEADHGG